MRHWLPLALFVWVGTAPALADMPPSLPVLPVPEESPTPPPVLTPASLTEHGVTRQEFVEEVAGWIHAFETRYHVSLRNPKETILLYADLNSGFREVAVDLETNYRLFENVDKFKYGTFEASLPITRLQAAQILYNVVAMVERSGVRRGEAKPPLILKDIPTDDAISESLNALTSRRLMIGFSDGLFRGPDMLIRAHYEILVDVFKRYLGLTDTKAG